MTEETIGPADLDEFMRTISLPEMVECRICSVCAIAAGTEFPKDMMPGSFEVGQCPGCGRTTGLAKITDWSFPK